MVAVFAFQQRRRERSDGGEVSDPGCHQQILMKSRLDVERRR